MQRIDIDKIKAHIERNRTKYICAGAMVSAIGFALITRYIMRRVNLSEVHSVSDAGVHSVPRPIVRLGDSSSYVSANGKNISQNIKVIYNGEKGHPGFVTRCLETGDVFSSQKKAARFAKVSPSIMSSHLRGRPLDVNSLHFERVPVR